jgi:AhpC/TSA family protein/cytochrome c biogenesis DsbD-like protein
VQLQQSAGDFQKRGIGLAAISYDPPATLKAFATARGITFPLLSDEGSAVIKRFGILNMEATGKTLGIPYPGTFVVNARGIVTRRSFEERYQERASGASLTGTPVGQQPGADRKDTPHLTLTTSSSDAVVAPGTRFSLWVDITPKPKMHVYAPEQKDYIPIEISLETDEAFKVFPPLFPKGEKFFFAPLKETQLVFSKPFRIAQDVTVSLSAPVRQRAAAAGATLTIKGTLRYQACDDKVCYLPQSIPLSWTVGLRPLAQSPRP